MVEFKVLNSSHEDLEDFSLPFAKLLFDAVASGASMGYLADVTLSQLDSYWAKVLADISRDKGRVIYALEENQIVGVVVLAFESNPNAQHRAEVKKFIVRSESQGKGIGRKLLSILEMEAKMAGKSLLILDTETDSVADSLYQRLEWVKLGTMPQHSAAPSGELKPTTFYYKLLS